MYVHVLETCMQHCNMFTSLDYFGIELSVRDIHCHGSLQLIICISLARAMFLKSIICVVLDNYCWQLMETFIFSIASFDTFLLFYRLFAPFSSGVSILIL